MKLFKISLMNNFTYDVPKDKEQLIYDFYAVTNLSGGMLPGFPEPLHSSFRRNEDTLDFIRKEIMNQLCDYLIPHLKKALLFSVSAEFRHIFDKIRNTSSDITTLFKSIQADKFVDKYTRNYIARTQENSFSSFLQTKKNDQSLRHEDDDKGYVNSFNAVLDTGYSAKKFFLIAEKAFNELSWSSSYGGEPWGEIAKYAAKLYDIKDNDDLMTKITLIDHIYHLQHNTDTVFNKLRAYYKEGYSWIKKGLDFRADSTQNFYKLVDKCSDGLRPFLYALIHDMYGISRESFEQKKKENNVVNKAVNKDPEDEFMLAVVGNDVKSAKQFLQSYSFTESLLQEAMDSSCQYGNLDIIDLIAHHLTDINYDNGTAMIFAIHGKMQSSVYKLLENGASVESADNAILKKAIKVKDYDIVRILVDYGVNIYTRDILDYAMENGDPRDKGSQDIVNLISELQNIGLENQNKMIELLIEKIQQNDIKGMKEAIENGANIHFDYEYPLYSAIAVKNIEMISMLLSYGANPNIDKTYTKKNNKISIMSEKDETSFKILELMYKHAYNFSKHVDIFFIFGIEQGNNAIVDMAIKNGAYVNYNASEALYIACKQNNAEMVGKLLSGGINVENVKQTLKTLSLSDDILKEFAEYSHHFDTNEKVDNKQQMWQHDMSNDKEYQKNYFSEQYDLNCKKLKRTLSRQDSGMAKKIVDNWLDLNGNINKTDSYPLSLAAAFGNIEIVQYMVEKGYVTPFIVLEQAVSNKHFDVVKYLFEITGYGIYDEERKKLSKYRKDNSEIWEYIEKQHEKNIECEYFPTLKKCVLSGDVDTIKNMILSFGIHNMNFHAQHDILLKLACQIGDSGAGSLAMVKCLVEDAGMSIYGSYARAMNVSCEIGNLDVVKYFIANGYNVHYSNDMALQSAFYYDKTEVIYFLIEHGADISVINFQSKSGVLPEKLKHYKNYFSENKKTDLQWNDGTWDNGVWEDGIWNNGLWKGGTWKNGTWENGTWNGGIWKNGVWENGTWLDGIWENGVWEDGIWNNGTWFGGAWNGGKWGYGWIKDEEKIGNFESTWEWSGSFVYSPINPRDYFDKKNKQNNNFNETPTLDDMVGSKIFDAIIFNNVEQLNKIYRDFKNKVSFTKILNESHHKYLSNAILAEFDQIVKDLITYGAKINAQEFEASIRKSNLYIFEIIFSSCDEKIKTEEFLSNMLRYASQMGSFNIVQYLVTKGVKITEASIFDAATQDIQNYLYGKKHKKYIQNNPVENQISSKTSWYENYKTQQL